MQVAYIFDEKKVKTGAHHINRLIVEKLRELGVQVKNYYPKLKQDNDLIRFKGLKNILFFYSLVEQKRHILQADIIQGTTYTPLSFLGFGIPVVCHFGSTTWGLVDATPQTHRIEEACKEVIYQWKRDNVISEVNIKSRRSMRDIAEVELYTSLLADAVIATSEIVRSELIGHGVPAEKITVIHNAIEDYWFASAPRFREKASLVFLGRIAHDVFNLKLKGMDRAVAIYRAFPAMEKLTIAASQDSSVLDWVDETIPHHISHLNLEKEDILTVLKKHAGSFVLLTSRYEGFSLSLVEAMSQGLIPLAYPVGVVPEIIRSGKNGFIIRSVNDAKRIIQRLAGNDEERRRLSSAARETARQFRGDVMAAKLEALYVEVLKKENSPSRKFEGRSEAEEQENANDLAAALAIVKKDESTPFKE